MHGIANPCHGVTGLLNCGNMLRKETLDLGISLKKTGAKRAVYTFAAPYLVIRVMRPASRYGLTTENAVNENKYCKDRQD